MDLEAEASDANKALQKLDSGMQQTVSKFAKNLLKQSRKATIRKRKTPEEAEFGSYPHEKIVQQPNNADAVQEIGLGTEVLKPAARASPTAKKATVGATNPLVEDEAKVTDHLYEDESVSSNSDMDIVNNSSEDDESHDDRSNMSVTRQLKASKKEQTHAFILIPRKKPSVTKNCILS